MKTRARCTVLSALALLFTTGCGDGKCNMDTDCPLPKVCISGACVARGGDVTTDMLPDSTPDVLPDSMDVPDGEIPDTPVESDVVTDDGGGTCTWAFAPVPRAIFTESGGTPPNSGPTGDPDRPVLVNIDGTVGEEVWIAGRIFDPNGKIAMREVDPRTANASSSLYSPLGNIDLDARHPVNAVGGEFAVVLMAGGFTNPIIHFTSGNPPTPATAEAFTTSNAYSTMPASATNGTEVLATWRQGNDVDANSTIDFARLDGSGSVVGSGTATGTGTQDIGEPHLVFNGAGYGLAYFTHLGAGADTANFVELNGDGTVVPGSALTMPLTESDNVVVGDPVMGWSGARYAMLWEEGVESGTGTASHLHFVLIPLGGGSAVVDTTIEASLSPAVGTITPRQPGMMDLVWTGDRYGVIWVHEDITTGSHPWFFELQADGTVSSTPENLREDTTNTHHPAVTWVDLGGDEECFVFAWTQFDSSDAQHKLFTYSYCCTI